MIQIITSLELAFLQKNQYNEIQTIVLIILDLTFAFAVSGVMEYWLRAAGRCVFSIDKERCNSMLTADIIRIMLVVDAVAMMLLALLFLRQRRMSWVSAVGWGLLAVLVPVIGPFLVIANRPGVWDRSYSFKRDFQRVLAFFSRMLPLPVRNVRARGRRLLRQQH